MFGWKRKQQQDEEEVVQSEETVEQIEQPKQLKCSGDWTEEQHQQWHDAHAWRGPGDDRTDMERWMYSRRQRW
jgi:hypothetical protein